MTGTPDMIVNDALCRARVKANEQRIDKVDVQLEKHDEALLGVAECLAKLTALSEMTTKEMEETRTRLTALEMKPTNRWEKILTGIISGGGGAVIGALLMQLFNG